MAEYTKVWLSVEDQVEKLISRGVSIPDAEEGAQLLCAVGYYRLTGYLYPFRKSESYLDDQGRSRIQVFSVYRPGTSMQDAAALIDFDRRLRMLILEGIERIEVSLRMQIGYVLGRRSAFAHLDSGTFVASFTAAQIDPKTGNTAPSKHEQWLSRIQDRQNGSDEAFVAHFREKYGNQMPIWAPTEIMELGHLSRLYGGLANSAATEIAAAYDVPSKSVMRSWIASLNYVRNVAAHHGSLTANSSLLPSGRPMFRFWNIFGDEDSSKHVLGLYNALAVMAFLQRTIKLDSSWTPRMRDLMGSFPETERLTAQSMGVPDKWSMMEIWRP